MSLFGWLQGPDDPTNNYTNTYQNRWQALLVGIPAAICLVLVVPKCTKSRPDVNPFPKQSFPKQVTPNDPQT